MLKYGNEGTKYYEVKAPCIFPSWGNVFSNNRQYFSVGWGHVSALVIYLTATSEASNTVAMATATWHKYHCHAAQPC